MRSCIFMDRIRISTGLDKFKMQKKIVKCRKENYARLDILCFFASGATKTVVDTDGLNWS